MLWCQQLVCLFFALFLLACLSCAGHFNVAETICVDKDTNVINNVSFHFVVIHIIFVSSVLSFWVNRTIWNCNVTAFAATQLCAHTSTCNGQTEEKTMETWEHGKKGARWTNSFPFNCGVCFSFPLMLFLACLSLNVKNQMQNRMIPACTSITRVLQTQVHSGYVYILQHSINIYDSI